MSDWDTGADLPEGVPPIGPWLTHTRNPFCTAVDYLWFKYSSPGSNQAEQIQNSFTGSTSQFCVGNQYHGRFWSDYLYSIISPHPYQQWVVGSIHHDHLALSKVQHELDVPWDLARVVFLKAMHVHCQYRIWHVNPGAKMTYQGFPNSGRISRISKQTARPCNGA
jgi:hypothetical protein